MKKIILPMLLLMILGTSGCIFDPFYDGYGFNYGHYGHGQRGQHGGDDD
jgi:hypothetical protein